MNFWMTLFCCVSSTGEKEEENRLIHEEKTSARGFGHPKRLWSFLRSKSNKPQSKKAQHKHNKVQPQSSPSPNTITDDGNPYPNTITGDYNPNPTTIKGDYNQQQSNNNNNNNHSDTKDITTFPSPTANPTPPIPDFSSGGSDVSGFISDDEFGFGGTAADLPFGDVANMPYDLTGLDDRTLVMAESEIEGIVAPFLSECEQADLQVQQMLAKACTRAWLFGASTQELQCMDKAVFDALCGSVLNAEETCEVEATRSAKDSERQMDSTDWEFGLLSTPIKDCFEAATSAVPSSAVSGQSSAPCQQLCDDLVKTQSQDTALARLKAGDQSLWTQGCWDTFEK